MPDLRVEGSATAYQLYDIGYAVRLDRAHELLGDLTRGRTRPARPESRSIQIRTPPLVVSLGVRDVHLADGRDCVVDVSASLFDFGVCSLRLAVRAPGNMSWAEYVAFANAIDRTRDLAVVFDTELERLVRRIEPAIERPRIADVHEDYAVFRVTALRDGGSPAALDAMTDEMLVALLIGERRDLAPNARRELLTRRFSYYADDLVVLTWDNALVVEPRSDDVDVEYVLEFANAQLLELRVYDAELDAELPELYDRIEATRKRWRAVPAARFRGVMADTQTRVADITEVVERAENALKIMDDVYLARVYGAALELFRATAWRQGIERKLQIFRDTYSMLSAEAQGARAELLEIAIVLLFVFEIVLGFFR